MLQMSASIQSPPRSSLSSSNAVDFGKINRKPCSPGNALNDVLSNATYKATTEQTDTAFWYSQCNADFPWDMLSL